MKKYLLPITFVTNLFVVIGCASMNQEECETADWMTVGYEDGTQGRPTVDISRHREACAQHGVTPDLEAYLVGWEDGVLRYCTRHSGFVTGSRGGSYAGVCPEDLQEDFLFAYNDGRHLYNLRSKVEGIESEISRNREAIKEINKKTKALTKRLESSKMTDKDRTRVQNRIRKMKKEKRQLKVEIVDLKYRLGRADVRYEDYRSEIESQYIY